MPSKFPLRLQPIVHVGNMQNSLRFYEALGAEIVVENRDGDFALIRVGSTEVGLLAHPPNPEQSEDYVELAFAADAPLREVEADLRSKGVTILRVASAEQFGEQLQIESPDGLLVKINRLERKTFA